MKQCCDPSFCLSVFPTPQVAARYDRVQLRDILLRSKKDLTVVLVATNRGESRICW